ncbi:c-type cytochrome [Rhodobacter sp. Har01]|uniref:c-type cytochrome n=1 Tax=Rhodobacter sp. Har01 TaxID=2883999 RepID=UPI001D06FEDA|nr:c-type cytochrome [Rhodobacter sp. Har01]MCB6179289.1 c-type cytochrome [Rhodobacter sp. Har01]
MSRSRDLLLASVAAACLAGPALADKLGLGRPALPEEVAAWDLAVLPDGTGLPEGSGDVLTGEEVFAEKCATCHGEFAEGLDAWPVLAGGAGTLTDARPVKTIGSYWPHLSTVFDYVHRSMPFGSAQTVTTDETYAIAAFLLYSNGLVEDDFELSKENFTTVTLPNADGFYPDDRAQSEYPLFTVQPCMESCRSAPPQVTKRAIELNVTPEDPDGRPAGSLPLVTAAAPAAPAEASSAPPAAGADQALVAAGEKVFKVCSACHRLGEGAKNSTGPVLNGVIGRTAGTGEGFKYSKPMAEKGAAGLVWDAATIDAYLADPKGYIPKNKMSFAGLKKPEDRAAVIAYLATFGG